jgi:Hint domain
MSNKDITSNVYHTVTFGAGAYAGYSSLTVDALVKPNYTMGTPATYGMNGVDSALNGASLTNNSKIYGSVGYGLETNYGNAGTNGGYGVQFKAFGTITNSNTIKGGAGGYGYDSGGNGGVGVYLTGSGGTSTLTNNSGTIDGGAGGFSYTLGGTGGAGVKLTAGATLINNSKIIAGNGGQSSFGSGGDGGTGVNNPGGGSVGNYWDISGGSSYQGGVGGVGVYMHGGTLTNGFTVNNTQITGGESQNGSGSGGIGVYMDGGTLDNDAECSIGGGTAHDGASGGMGVLLKSSATLDNSGNVHGGYTSSGQGGVGLYIGTSGDDTNTSTGQIVGGSSSTGTGGAAVDLAANAQLTNDKYGTIKGGSTTGTGGVGVDISVSKGSLINAGSITGGGGLDAGAGVALSASMATATNTGSIAGGYGLAGGNGGVGVYLDGGTLTTSGSIDGGRNTAAVYADAIKFGPTASTMIVQEGAAFTGNIGGFAPGGDKIDITNLTPTQVASDFGVTATYIGGGVYEFRGSSGGETLTTGAADDGTLKFAGNYGNEEFFLSRDSNVGTNITLEPVCYLRGTRILTPTGEVLVESLQRGDRVVTRFGGLQEIKWIGRQSYCGAAVCDNREHMPVRLRAGSLGEGLPARDLYVSPGHSMLIGDTLVLAKSLVNGITITQSECPEKIDYFQIELAGHDCVIAEGTWSETYADWEEGRTLFHNAAEFHALFPDHRAPEEPILCAPRPERGAPLDALLRPIVASAARNVTPGGLLGFIDQVRGDWKLDGWALDEAHPELPVLLEILLEGRVIGTVLACDYREDLLKAGFGPGRCSFTFISPIKLRAALLATLQVRRAVDGASVQVSKSILDAASASAIIKPPIAMVA